MGKRLKPEPSLDEELEIADLLIAISRLDEGNRSCCNRVWHESQKEHWVGWLFNYNSPGAYRRKITKGRDAKFVYNHVACPEMLLFLAEAGGVEAKLVGKAKRASAAAKKQMAKVAAIRRVIPWCVVLEALRRSGHLSKAVSAD
jgi:hypothetical protein